MVHECATLVFLPIITLADNLLRLLVLLPDFGITRYKKRSHHERLE